LDHTNREKVLKEIEAIGSSGKTNILLITHHEEEIVPSIDRVLKLVKGRAN
jgi:ABC-type molybdenum transport system ATPase subunit/photorepair protein PhrA